ncbi:DegT/DnrJ/EryC1/StrS aminotransferase family protein [Kitasatospora sp. NRRL B-11411]|uniref:DegT/DnrJ/EryC1/StrS family aminotransferase n=1 Tax=Kitasatospora sp. NRRL B-11411 TaxID=1463822 RepID=UPI0004C45E98|nr:DegT/DnrJ/EryC1/StrS family aminotransferase [Kitasatospora sp. NRRL B-11411]
MTLATTTPARPGVERNATPYLYGPELGAIAEVLASGQYGHSDVTETFEQQVADFLGVREVVAVSSGTAALHAALVAAGVGAGDEVLVPSMTFCASVQAILSAGAEPRFVDVDQATMCTTPDLLRQALTERTSAVMPVLFGGRAVDLTPIADLLDQRGIAVVEDAAHAFGSHDRDGHKVGASGYLTCFSFGPIKNLTCGQGGAVVPRSPEEADRLRTLRLLGMVESAADRAASTTYQVTAAGFRYPLSALNAAIGTAQLAHFEEAATVRRGLWRTYRDALAGLPGVELVDVDVERSVPHLCVVTVPDRDRVWAEMRDAGIGVGVHYPPNHLQPAFSRWTRSLPATEQLAGRILTLPFHQHLTEDDVHRTVAALREALTTGDTR